MNLSWYFWPTLRFLDPIRRFYRFLQPFTVINCYGVFPPHSVPKERFALIYISGIPICQCLYNVDLSLFLREAAMGYIGRNTNIAISRLFLGFCLHSTRGCSPSSPLPPSPERETSARVLTLIHLFALLIYQIRVHFFLHLHGRLWQSLLFIDYRGSLPLLQISATPSYGPAVVRGCFPWN